MFKKPIKYICLLIAVVFFCSFIAGCALVPEKFGAISGSSGEAKTPYPTMPEFTPYIHTSELLTDFPAILSLAEKAVNSEIDITTLDMSPYAYIFNRYYISQMKAKSEKLASVCVTAYAAMLSSVKLFSIPGSFNLSVDDMKACLLAVMHDSPELFNTSGTYAYYTSGENVVSVEFTFTMEKQSYLDALQATFSVVEKDFASALSGSDYEKECKMYDIVIEKCKYSLNSEAADTAYGALALGSALCEGYAHAANLLFQYFGILSFQVTGKAVDPKTEELQSHAWNIVRINGQFYQIDLTWDDFDPEKAENTQYAYLNVTDEEIMAHREYSNDQLKSYIPVCTSKEANFYTVNDFVIAADSNVKDGFIALIDRALTNSQYEDCYVMVKVSTEEQYNSLHDNQYDWIRQWNDNNMSRHIRIKSYKLLESKNMKIASYLLIMESFK